MIILNKWVASVGLMLRAKYSSKHFSDINSFDPQFTPLKMNTFIMLILQERKLRHRKANVKWYVVNEGHVSSPRLRGETNIES